MATIEAGDGDGGDDDGLKTGSVAVWIGVWPYRPWVGC